MKKKTKVATKMKKKIIRKKIYSTNKREEKIMMTKAGNKRKKNWWKKSSNNGRDEKETQSKEKKKKERTKEKKKEEEREKGGFFLKSQGRVSQWKEKKKPPTSMFSLVRLTGLGWSQNGQNWCIGGCWFTQALELVTKNTLGGLDIDSIRVCSRLVFPTYLAHWQHPFTSQVELVEPEVSNQYVSNCVPPR